MSEDSNARLREKTLHIISLNQKIEALQAQLEATQRRAIQFGEKIASLEAEIRDKQSENDVLSRELSNSRAALESVGKEMQGIRAEQTHLLSKKKPADGENSLKDELATAQMKTKRLQDDLRRFSEVATVVVNGDDRSCDLLKEVLLEVGDPKYRVLSMVLSSGSARLDEIASTLVINTAQAMEFIDVLQAEGEVEVRDGNTVVPGRKYRELEIPKTVWASLEPTEVFAHLEQFVGRTDDQGTIVRALEVSVEILEQKLARGGALIFQMRRTADTWKKQHSSIEKLQYTIREWATRAKALS